MEIYQWSDEFSVGEPTMDAHHQQLFAIIERLHQAVDQGRGEAEIGEILGELLDYTEYHFAEEERMMEQLGYPTLEEHKALHRRFVEQLRNCEADVQRGAARVATLKALNTAAKWLRDHIMGVDQGYGPLIEQQREGKDG